MPGLIGRERTEDLRREADRAHLKLSTEVETLRRMLASPGNDAPLLAHLKAAPGYEAALAAGRTNVTLAICPNADHVLKYEETPVDQITAMTALRYNAADRVLDPDVVAAILGWLAEQNR